MVFIEPPDPSPTPIETGCCKQFPAFNSYGVSNFNLYVKDKDRIPKDLRYHVDWGDGTFTRSGVLSWTPGEGYTLDTNHAYPAFQQYQAAIVIENAESKRRSKCALVKTIVASVTPTATTSITPTITPTITRTSSTTPSVTRTSTVTPTITPTNTSTVTATVTSTVTSSNTPTITPTLTSTVTPSITSTITPSVTPTVSPTLTSTQTPTITSTVTPTVTPTVTSTITPSVTSTATPTITPTVTQTVTSTITSTVTPSITPTATPSNTTTPTVTSTVTPSISSTITPTITSTVTPTVTPTVSPSVTATPTNTITPTITSSITPSVTPTCEMSYLNVRFQYFSTYVVEGYNTGVRVYREPCCHNSHYTGAFSVKYRTFDSPGTAVSGQDYPGETGILSFAVGEDMKIIPVRTLSDNLDEPSEFFNVELYDLDTISCVHSRILYKNPYQVLITDTTGQLYDHYELCDTFDGGVGNQLSQMIPNASWGSKYASTGLAYTGGAFTYTQTGVF